MKKLRMPAQLVPPLGMRSHVADRRPAPLSPGEATDQPCCGQLETVTVVNGSACDWRSPLVTAPMLVFPRQQETSRTPQTALLVPGRERRPDHRASTATSPLGPLHRDLVLPTYPTGNLNMAPRTRRETAIVVRLHPRTGSLQWPRSTDFAPLQQAVKRLSQANAYNAQDFGVDLVPKSPTLPYYDVPQSTPSAGNTGDVFNAIADIVREYKSLVLEYYDYVIIIFRGTTNQAPSNVGRVIMFPDSYRGNPAIAQVPMDVIALGLLHEMSHKYNIGHAVALLEWNAVGPSGSLSAGIVDYGDTFDYMGAMSAGLWRFNPFCFPKCEPACTPPPCTVPGNYWFS